MASQIAKLEKALADTPADPNPLLPLLASARNADAAVVHKAVWALYRAFGTQLSEGRVGGITGGDGDVEASAGLKGSGKVRAWIRDRLLEYISILGGLLCDAEESLRQSALQLLFAMLPPLSAASRVPIHMPYFRMVVGQLLSPQPSQRGTKSGAKPRAEFQEGDEGDLPTDVVDAAVESYWAPYDDLRLFFFREAAAAVLAGKVTNPDNLMSQLVQLTNLPKEQEDLNAFFIPGLAEPPSDPERKRKKGKTAANGGKRKKAKGGEIDALPEWMETYESESESDAEESTGGKRKRASALGTHAAVHSVRAHVNAYTDAWEAVLSSLPLDQGWTRRVLANLHGKRGILAQWAPTRRIRLADWLGGTVDAGGAHALLAMNGLFVLMTTYNLDYPRFYERLYALLDADVLHARYRARFFRLLDTFLRSPLLSASLIAAFIKRLARLSLTAPPAGAIIVIPFVYNLFKRHPGAMPMLHRLADEADPDAPGGDPYDASEPVPGKSRAIDSSAWELAALQQHYFAPIATLAKVFSEQFTKPEFNLEDFLDHGYGTLFETETNRRLKNAPALAMDLELGGEMAPLFPAPGDPGPRDAVSELWAF